jgi:hypothetical protein
MVDAGTDADVDIELELPGRGRYLGRLRSQRLKRVLGHVSEKAGMVV